MLVIPTALHVGRMCVSKTTAVDKNGSSATSAENMSPYGVFFFTRVEVVGIDYRYCDRGRIGDSLPFVIRYKTDVWAYLEVFSGAALLQMNPPLL